MVSPRYRLVAKRIDSDAVLRVHHDRGADRRRRLHSLEDLTVVGEVHPRIRREQLERRDAGSHHVGELSQCPLVNVGDHHVEPVVDE